MNDQAATKLDGRAGDRPVSSMTGFARFEGEADGAVFVWEIRAVNGKGLEARFRLPQGLERLEADCRRRLASHVSRGNLQVALSLDRGNAGSPNFAINHRFLDDLLRLSDELVRQGKATAPSADGLLALRGVIDVADAENGAEWLAERVDAFTAGFEQALNRLCEARALEGASLAAVLESRLVEIEHLIVRAERDPARDPAAIRARLSQQVGDLIGPGVPLDEQRLYQEAAILATRADIQEELDRLRAHLVAARTLIAAGGAIGRRLDFLSQEFNRESNTMCAKSNSTSLTTIGLELKVVVDQFREQVQNIE